jgi:hypothetical protein
MGHRRLLICVIAAIKHAGETVIAGFIKLAHVSVAGSVFLVMRWLSGNEIVERSAA